MKKIELIPFSKNGGFCTNFNYETGLLEELSGQYAAYFKKNGYVRPWIGYLAACQQKIIGTCSFKGKPVSKKVEIAYFVFPEWEKRGFATEMVRMLIKIALDELPSIIITARTLPLKNASTRVLEKSGFLLQRTLLDPEDGEIWEWYYESPKLKILRRGRAAS